MMRLKEKKEPDQEITGQPTAQTTHMKQQSHAGVTPPPKAVVCLT